MTTNTRVSSHTSDGKRWLESDECEVGSTWVGFSSRGKVEEKEGMLCGGGVEGRGGVLVPCGGEAERGGVLVPCGGEAERGGVLVPCGGEAERGGVLLGSMASRAGSKQMYSLWTE